MTAHEETWSELGAVHDPKLVQATRELFDSPESFSVRPPLLANDVGVDEIAVRALLEALVDKGILEKKDIRACSVCSEPLEDVDDRVACVICDSNFEDHAPMVETVYFRRGERERDPTWMITIHGMNTRGSWQEEYAWKLSKAYGYSIPTFVYKYGHILISPFLPWRQKKYRDRLVRALTERTEEMKRTRHGGRPDVIAHSFGTWLLSQALTSEAGSDLKLGRIILTGSVVRPDFDWQSMIKAERVEAVLYHTGGKDCIAPLAPYFIRDAGPSGRGGGNRDTGAFHEHSNLSHSGFFSDEHFDACLHDVWTPFLTRPENLISEAFPDQGRKRPWRRTLLHDVTNRLKYVIILGLAALAILAVVALILGVTELPRFLSELSRLLG